MDGASSPTATESAGQGDGGGEVDAEFTFPASPADVSALLKKLKPTKKGTITVTVPAGASDQRMSDLVNLWAAISKKLVGLGVKQVVVRLPLDGRLVTTPGLFGSPREAGDHGDDHWRVSDYPPKSNGLDIVLARLADPKEERRREVVRGVGCHVVGFAVRRGRGFQGVVRGVATEQSGRRTPVRFNGPTRSNPTSAVSEALSRWLKQASRYPAIDIWLSDDLIRSMERGHYGGQRRFEYGGVNVPDIDEALRRVERSLMLAGVVTVHRAKKGGAMFREILGCGLAVEEVQAFEAEVTVGLPNSPPPPRSARRCVRTPRTPR